MSNTSRALLLALGMLMPSVVVAQDKSGACALLTTQELTAAVGMPIGVGAPNETVIPSGPAKGETMHGCQWRAGETGMVTVSTIRAPSAEQRAAGMAGIRKVFAGLKAKGWTEQSEAFGSSIKCSVMTPPAGSSNTPSMTGCMGEAKGEGISVGFMYPGTTLPIAKLKALFDKASGRIS